MVIGHDPYEVQMEKDSRKMMARLFTYKCVMCQETYTTEVYTDCPKCGSGNVIFQGR